MEWDLATSAGEISWADGGDPEVVESQNQDTSMSFPLVLLNQALHQTWVAHSAGFVPQDQTQASLALYSCDQTTGGWGNVEGLEWICPYHCQNCGYSWGYGSQSRWWQWNVEIAFWGCACY
jgi:hypothetical protein